MHALNPRDERLENVRLSLDISMFNARLWTDPDGETYEYLPDPEQSASFDNAKANIISRWIDTSSMVVDCMTKRMKPDVLFRIMDGYLDLTPTEESLLIKSRKRAGRAKAKSKTLGEFLGDSLQIAEATETKTNEANFVQELYDLLVVAHMMLLRTSRV